MFSWNSNHNICWCGKATDPIESDRLDVISGRYDCLSNEIQPIQDQTTIKYEDQSPQGNKRYNWNLDLIIDL